jgi:hypothetical protein
MSDPGKALYDEFQNDLVGICSKRVGTSIREIIAQSRAESRQPNEEECNRLADIFTELLSPKSCEKWFARGTLINPDEDTPLRYISEDLPRDNKLPPPFYRSPRPRNEWGKMPRPFIQPLARFTWEEDWPLERNALKLRLYRMAALLEYFRRGEWDWKDGRSEEHLSHIENLLNNFVRRKAYRTQFIKNLCDTSLGIAEIAVYPIVLTAKDKETLRAAFAEKLSEETLAEFLSEENFRYGDYGNPYHLWKTDKKKWHSFQTRINQLADQFQLRS